MAEDGQRTGRKREKITIGARFSPSNGDFFSFSPQKGAFFGIWGFCLRLAPFVVNSSLSAIWCSKIGIFSGFGEFPKARKLVQKNAREARELSISLSFGALFSHISPLDGAFSCSSPSNGALGAFLGIYKAHFVFYINIFPYFSVYTSFSLYLRVTYIVPICISLSIVYSSI